MQRIRITALGTALVAAGLSSSAGAQVTRATPATPAPQAQAHRTTPLAGAPQARGRALALGALFRGIELSGDQKAQIKIISERYRPRREALSARRGAAERPDSVRAAQLRYLTQRERAEMRAVLTPAQQTQFDQNVAGLGEHPMQRRDDRRVSTETAPLRKDVRREQRHDHKQTRAERRDSAATGKH